jgi:hypothetical protein
MGMHGEAQFICQACVLIAADRRPCIDHSTPCKQVRILQCDSMGHFMGRVRPASPLADGTVVIPKDVIRERIPVFIFQNGDCRCMLEMI